MGLVTGCMGRYQVSTFSPPINSVLISIVDPGTNSPRIFPDWSDLLVESFWDVTAEPHAPTEEQCRRIWEFIQLYKDKNIFAHCEAGISRSGAIREYLVRNGWINIIPAQIFPNILILNYLNRFDREKEKQ
jgi:hypothetical protein